MHADARMRLETQTAAPHFLNILNHVLKASIFAREYVFFTPSFSFVSSLSAQVFLAPCKKKKRKTERKEHGLTSSTKTDPQPKRREDCLASTCLKHGRISLWADKYTDRTRCGLVPWHRGRCATVLLKPTLLQARKIPLTSLTRVRER